MSFAIRRPSGNDHAPPSGRFCPCPGRSGIPPTAPNDHGGGCRFGRFIPPKRRVPDPARSDSWPDPSRPGRGECAGGGWLTHLTWLTFTVTPTALATLATLGWGCLNSPFLLPVQSRKKTFSGPARPGPTEPWRMRGGKGAWPWTAYAGLHIPRAVRSKGEGWGIPTYKVVWFHFW